MTDPAAAGPPRVFLSDPDALAAAAKRARAGDEALRPALERLRRDAEQALRRGPFSVTDKTQTPPSGDKHDYMSVGPYWWPDPDTPDGLPYVRRDGEVHPGRAAIGDADRLKDMIRCVRDLAAAAYFTGDRRYALRAAMLLRAWYLDPPTRMNPNLNYAQAIPGRCEGRGIGIVDTAGMIAIVDAVGMLQARDAWSEDDDRRLRAWFGELLDWLTAGKHGRDEDRTKNNHATQYDAQVAAYALYVGRKERAREVLSAVGRRRIATQIEPDGRQPHELARTRSWDYSCANLRNFCHLALLGERAGVDLWSFETDDGRSIRKALDFLVPFAIGEKRWKHKQLKQFRPQRLLAPLLLAWQRYDDPRYRAALEKLPASTRDDLPRLLHAGPGPDERS